MLCVLLTSSGCNSNPDTVDETASVTVSQETSLSKSEETSTAETTAQTERTATAATEESETEVVPTETQPLLKLNKKELYESEWSEDFGMALTKLDCSTVLLGNEDAERYPELAKALSEASDYYEVNLLEEHDMLIESAKESISSGAEGFDTLVSTLDVHVRRADNVVLSVLYDSYYYNGMNDGSRSFWGGNYDTETGKELYLPDVVTNIDEFAKVVENKLFSTVGADVFYSDTIIEDYFKEYSADGTHWTMEYNGVTVYFDEGEVANSGFGAINLTIEFEEYPDLFNKKYIDVPETYIVGLPIKSTFYTDLDGDGINDELTVIDSYDEENDYYATLYIYVADVYYAESFWAYACEPYYVKTADGRNYLYIFTELETQMYLHIYEMTNSTISKVGEANVSPFYNDGISAVPTDPNSMHFDIFSDEAGGGVSEGNDLFSVGLDGIPAQG
ncbi:MAG: hypothetical protein IJZ61_02000 [Oscillospiraceae bacterium]|nr:hypothetical protein [Oscillospiraceae bacterium]